PRLVCLLLFVVSAPSSVDLYTLSLHDALPILYCAFGSTLYPFTGIASGDKACPITNPACVPPDPVAVAIQSNLTLTSFCWFKIRSEEHTSELQSRENLVCRLLLEKIKT